MNDKIFKLISLFNENNIDGYIITSTDEFNNEYVPEHLQRLKYLTGFTGSNGIALITREHLALFTDGRYTLQASLELGDAFQVFDISEKKYEEFLSKLDGLNIGFDPNIITKTTYDCYNKLASRFNSKLISIEPNLVDLIWDEKELPNKSQIFELDASFSGATREKKLEMVLKEFPKNADYMFLNTPESICWLLNLRANDIEFTPSLLSYLLISKDGEIELFVDKQNLEFSLEGIAVKPFEELKKRYLEVVKLGKKVALNLTSTSVWFYDNTPKLQLIQNEDPCLLPKACKNEVELEGIRSAHIQDAIALCRFFFWLEGQIEKGIDEHKAAEKLLEFRKERQHFYSLSFPTISAFAENGAIIHYRPSERNSKTITSDGLYLIDSGGQYLNGTTDVTRVLCFGAPTPEEVYNYTLVLKGMISLSHTIFPISTTGMQLDAIARRALWQKGLDFAHGTGHGVGHFLSVHEGPNRIGKGLACHVPLREGMVTSIEPGFYKNYEYGIRIENLTAVKKAKFDGFLEFETLTMVPIETRLIDPNMLENEELTWLNQYHEQVYQTLSPHLNKKEREWLMAKTNPL